MSAVLAPDDDRPPISRSEFFELKQLAHFDWMLKREHEWRERNRARECVGKHPFANQHQATKAIHANTNAGVAPYRCGFCGSWHLGTNRRRERRAA